MSEAFEKWWKDSNEISPASEASRYDVALTAWVASQKLATPQWQPVESAPKDGTRILVYNVVAGIYSTAPYENGNSIIYPLHGWSHHDSVHFPEPTHWQPLAQPPK